MRQLNIIILGGHWELWFLNDERVFSDHQMEWMLLLEMLPKWGSFSWSYAYVEPILEGGRENTFSLLSSQMPRTFTEFTKMLTLPEYDRLMETLNENRSQL